MQHFSKSFISLTSTLTKECKVSYSVNKMGTIVFASALDPFNNDIIHIDTFLNLILDTKDLKQVFKKTHGFINLSLNFFSILIVKSKPQAKTVQQ